MVPLRGGHRQQTLSASPLGEASFPVRRQGQTASEIHTLKQQHTEPGQRQKGAARSALS